MTKLLTSVRNLKEAKLAIAGGSDWLDLKEPNEGALGAVPLEVVMEVVAWANEDASQIPTSATIGDCWEQPEVMPERVAQMSQMGVDFVKVGIFANNFSDKTAAAIKSSVQFQSKLIVLCFAEAPPSAERICEISSLGASGLMLDTANKNTGGLLDKMTIEEIQKFVVSVRNQNCLCGLAGSLKPYHIERLANCEADYFGFRGALCDDHRRAGEISSERVTALKNKLHHFNSCNVNDVVDAEQISN